MFTAFYGRNTDAKNFYVISGGLGGTYLTAKPTFKTQDELYRDRKTSLFLAKVSNGVYRLHSRNRKNIKEYHDYQVHCPHCGCRMEEAAPAIDDHVLPLYACRNCYNR